MSVCVKLKLQAYQGKEERELSLDHSVRTYARQDISATALGRAAEGLQLGKYLFSVCVRLSK